MTKVTTPTVPLTSRTAQIIAAAQLLRWAQLRHLTSVADGAKAVLDRIRREERA